MGNSFEIVLEHVPIMSVVELIGELLSRVNNVESFESSEENFSGGSSEFDAKVLLDKLLTRREGTLIICARRLNIDSIELDVVLLRVIKYDKNIDFEISFDIADSQDAEAIMTNFQKYILRVAKLFMTGDVYGGLEPAEDLTTRYFTNKEPGPMLKRTA